MNVRVNSQEPPAQSIRYRDVAGDTWESRPNGRVTLVEVSDPENADIIGDPSFTGIPFAAADREHHLTPITGGAR